MSELSVGTLSGLAANSYVIDVASGSTLDLSNATGTLPAAQLPAGSILQVVSTNKNDTFSTTSSSLTDVTGLSTTITPAATANKVLIVVSVLLSNSGAGNPGSLQLADGSNNPIAPPASPSSRTQGFASAIPNDTATAQVWTFNFLHSPSTTSAITYKVRARTNGGTLYVNRTGNDADDANTLRGSSTVTLMEVAG
jgi:hypothetical protein